MERQGDGSEAFREELLEKVAWRNRMSKST